MRLPGAASNAGGPRRTSLVIQELASKLSAPVSSVAPAKSGSLKRIRSMDEMTRTVLIGMAMLAVIVVSSIGMFYFIGQPGLGNNAKIEKIEENKGSPTTRVVPVEHRSPT